MTTSSDHVQGVQGARSDPLASRGERSESDTSVSDVSDTPTACHAASPTRTPAGEEMPGAKAPAAGTAGAEAGATRRRRGRPHLDTRYDSATLEAIRTRADRLEMEPSAWVRSVVRDALDQRRTDELDAAVDAALVGVEARVQASADARVIAGQVRPLAINVNDLDMRARRGEPVTLSGDVPELIELLREVRKLLGDRTAS